MLVYFVFFFLFLFLFPSVDAVFCSVMISCTAFGTLLDDCDLRSMARMLYLPCVRV